MSSTSETGHARNVGNLQSLVTYAVSLGERYRPSNNDISVESLQNLANTSGSSQKAVSAAEVIHMKAVSARMALFNPLGKLSTRIVNALVSCKADKRSIDAASMLSKKINGTRTSPRKSDAQKETLAAAGKSTKENSTSQMSFDLRIENFGKLILLLKETPQYAPNEEELTIEGLEALLDSMSAANGEVKRHASTLANLRIERNNIIYAEDKGIPDTAMSVKAYFKSAFGSTGPEYKEISKLGFTRIKKSKK